MEQLERVKEREVWIKLEYEELQDKLDRFEALQADADDAMRAHLMNGENHADSD
jgi:hypothetical protein